MEDLRSTARLFQTTTCNSCRRPLELPAVHFLCMHSYHLDQNCINQESECNECASDHHHYERIKLKDQVTLREREKVKERLGLRPLSSRDTCQSSIFSNLSSFLTPCLYTHLFTQSGKALEHELFFSELEEHGYAAVRLCLSSLFLLSRHVPCRLIIRLLLAHTGGFLLW